MTASHAFFLRKQSQNAFWKQKSSRMMSKQEMWIKNVILKLMRFYLNDDVYYSLECCLCSCVLQVFQKELGKRTGSVQALKRSARELVESSHDDSSWVKAQMQELSTRWDTACSLSVSKQTRLEQALCQVRKRGHVYTFRLSQTSLWLVKISYTKNS